MAIESAAGIALVVATVAALVLANSGLADWYGRFWHNRVALSIGSASFDIDLRGVVDDGLMAIFFFVIGLEIKREWCDGELRDRRAARLPVVAALGGMIVPAVLFTVIAGSTAAGHGWGIPMATDIAFVVGVMALLGSRVPQPIKVFLLTLAIVDDLGAIVVIAVFYAGPIHWGWFAGALVGLAVVAGLRRLGVARYLPFVVVGVAVWFATWQSGVHATIAGVALAFLTPVRPVRDHADRTDGLDGSPLARLEELLHPWASFVIVPIFALANAGVELTTDLPDDGVRVLVGIVVGLVVGKFTGVLIACWLAVRSRFASLPRGIGWRHIAGAGALAGIGFTMSLFVTELAFVHSEAGAAFANTARQAILLASVLAAALGSAIFAISRRSGRAHASPR